MKSRSIQQLVAMIQESALREGHGLHRVRLRGDGIPHELLVQCLYLLAAGGEISNIIPRHPASALLKVSFGLMNWVDVFKG